MKKTKIKLILEKGISAGQIYGRVEYDDDLIVDSADSIANLEEKIKKHLKHFHDLDPSRVEFETSWES